MNRSPVIVFLAKTCAPLTRSVIYSTVDIQQIQKLASQDRIAFKRHTLLRMYQRKIRSDEVKEVLQVGQIVENYPLDHPLPIALLNT